MSNREPTSRWHTANHYLRDGLNWLIDDIIAWADDYSKRCPELSVSIDSRGRKLENNKADLHAGLADVLDQYLRPQLAGCESYCYEEGFAPEFINPHKPLPDSRAAALDALNHATAAALLAKQAKEGA